MTIHWSLLVPGLFLLLFPADRLLSSLVEVRNFNHFQGLAHNRPHRPWWWVPALWLDPLRGFFGALLLKPALAIPAARWETMPKAAYVSMMGVLAAGVLCQTFTRRGGERVLLAPVGFVVGLVAALTPWSVAVIATVTAVLGLFGLRQFYAFFSFGLAATALLGFVLDVEFMWIAPAVGAFALPVIAGILTGSALEVPIRDASGPVAPPISSPDAPANAHPASTRGSTL